MGYGRTALAIATLLAVAAGAAVPANATPGKIRKIAFQLCNDTIDTAFFAVAYESAHLSRSAQGWTKVAPGHCNVRDDVELSSGGWFSYYVITDSGKNFRATSTQYGEQVCARPEDFSLDKAAATDRLGSDCPPGYDLLNFRKVDAADVKASTFTVRLNGHGLMPQRS
jgi:uncharacterized membrane protein